MVIQVLDEDQTRRLKKSLWRFQQSGSMRFLSKESAYNQKDNMVFSGKVSVNIFWKESAATQEIIDN